MRTASLILALALAMVTPSIHAQSLPIAFNIGSAGFSCGINPNYCFGIPIVASTDKGVFSGTLFYDVSGNADFITFYGGLSFLGSAQGIGDKKTFVGVDINGQNYTAVVMLDLQPYKGCVSGRGTRCSTYYRAEPTSAISVAYQ
jgi:hypothetical protein